MTDKDTRLDKLKEKTLAHLKGENQIKSHTREKWKAWVKGKREDTAKPTGHMRRF